jgi:hypothetical protein
VEDAAFEIVLTGRFTLEQVVVRWRPEARRRPDPTIDALIAAEWARREAEAAATGRLLFPGPLCRLDAFATAGETLRLTLGPTDYREFLGTNVAGLATIQARHPRDWRDYLADPLAVCAALVSADGWLPVMRRGEQVAEYPGFYHVVGGHPTPAHDDGVGGVSPFLALHEEIAEETGLAPGEIAELVCLGLIRNRATAKPELVFEARLALDRAAIEARLASLGGSPEASAWVWLNDEPAAIAAFLTREAARIAPAGAACLTVYARRSRHAG